MSETDVFSAIAHPTRRRILRCLADRGPASLTQLADGFDESRQAIRKHVRVLTEAELVQLQRCGREQQCVLRAQQLAEVSQWVSLFEDHWDEKLSKLKAFVEQTSRAKPEREGSMAKKKSTNPSTASSSAAKKKTPKVSAVKGKTVAWYIGTLKEPQAEIVRELDALILATAPKATSSIKWAQPVYELDGPFCFLKAAKKHVTFGFWRGVDLRDDAGLLEGTGIKMRHMKLTSTSDIQKAVFKKMIKQAVQFNKELGDPSR